MKQNCYTINVNEFKNKVKMSKKRVGLNLYLDYNTEKQTYIQRKGNNGNSFGSKKEREENPFSKNTINSKNDALIYFGTLGKH